MDRSLTHVILFSLATACSSGGSAPPCAAPPPSKPAHADDLVDTTEKEAVPVKPLADDAPPVSPPPETPAPTGERAECVIPPKECATPEACAGLEELCHTIGDPIARNDKDGFQKVVATGSGLEGKEPRSAFGFPASGPVKITLNRDCTPCRRSFVSFAIEVGKVKGLAMVDSKQITSWAKGKP